MTAPARMRLRPLAVPVAELKRGLLASPGLDLVHTDAADRGHAARGSDVTC